MSTEKKSITLYIPSLKFVIPYLQRELGEDYNLELGESKSDYGVAILTPGEEDKAPEGFLSLVCPNVVGTGMRGTPMEIAKGIASGQMYHIHGNETHISVIHAVDVARAARLALDCQGEKFTITDGEPVNIDQLTDAIAFRVNQKRVLSTKPFWANFLMPSKLKKLVITDDVYEGSEFAARFDFKPNRVVDYLLTHNYDEESL